VSEVGRRRRKDSSQKVAHRMADAVAYLSRVAEDAGMNDISADLLAIKRRLAVEEKHSCRRGTAPVERTVAARVRRRSNDS